MGCPSSRSRLIAERPAQEVEAVDRTLDRVSRFDERSRAFPIRTLLAARTPRSYTWSVDAALDQGREGACVGYGWAHELAARPAVNPVSTALAQDIYRAAQRIDEWAGEAYDGTSVLAGAKTVLARRYMDSYRWCFGIDDLVLALGYSGPVVLGLNWWTGMFVTDPAGYIHPTGQVEGGHCLIARAVDLRTGTIKLRNSWGPLWGVGGDALIRIPDLAALLADQGDACVPIGRRVLTAPTPA